MNEYKHGLGDFERNGHFSGEERDAETNTSWEDSVEKLMPYAEEIAHAEQIIYKAKKAALVRQFVNNIGGIEHLTEKMCITFAEKNKNYFDQGEIIYAIARALDKDLMK